VNNRSASKNQELQLSSKGSFTPDVLHGTINCVDLWCHAAPCPVRINVKTRLNCSLELSHYSGYWSMCVQFSCLVQRMYSQASAGNEKWDGWEDGQQVVPVYNGDLGQSPLAQWAPSEGYGQTHRESCLQTVNMQWHKGENVPYSTFYATYIGLMPTPPLNVMIFCQKVAWPSHADREIAVHGLK